MLVFLTGLPHGHVYMCIPTCTCISPAGPHPPARVDLSSRPGPSISEEMLEGERASSRSSSAADEGDSPLALLRPFSGDLGIRKN